MSPSTFARRRKWPHTSKASIEEANGDARFIAKALGDIARAKGMSQVARDAGLSRESLYKALSRERNPTLDTVLSVVGALGLRLRAEAAVDSGVAGAGASGYPSQPDRSSGPVSTKA